MHIGPHRVLTQDPEFGLAQIVEIAIRALSPAVNDTFTGVSGVDWLAETLLVLAESPSIENWFDNHGSLRLRMVQVKLHRLIKFAFDQVRQASGDNPAVQVRMLNLLGRLAHRLKGGENRNALLAQANAIWETALQNNPISADREDIETSWKKTCELLS